MANGFKETKCNDKWEAESDRKKREGWGQDGHNAFFFSQHREQSMLGSALKAWSVLIQKRSYISEKQTKHIRMDPLNPGQSYIH